MLFALLSALASAGNVLLDKFVLAKQRMKVSDYIPLLFVFLFLVTFLTLPWLGGVNEVLMFSQQYIFYFVLMVLLAVIWNIFYYQGLQKEKIIEFEMIILLTPLATVLLAALFFPEEFDPPVFWAAVIASLALLFSHLRKHHFEFDKYSLHLLLAVVLMAMEAMVQKELLYIYAPATLYALRTGLLALFFGLYYRPIMAHVNDHSFRLVFATAFLGAVYMVTKFYGFQQIGVTFTTLVLLVTPVITSWADAKLNGTPVKRRTILAFVVILLCVLYAIAKQGL